MERRSSNLSRPCSLGAHHNNLAGVNSSAGMQAPSPERRRQRFTLFGAIVFLLSIILLLSKISGWLTHAEDIDNHLVEGLRQVSAFAFAGHYIHDVDAMILGQSPTSANAGSLLIALISALPQAMIDSLSGGGWAILGFFMALTLGTLLLWDSIVKACGTSRTRVHWHLVDVCAKCLCRLIGKARENFYEVAAA